MLIDTLHHNSGVRRANWDFSRFHEIGSGYDRLTNLHYNFYQFYSNGFIAVFFAYVMHRVVASETSRLSIESDLGVCFVLAVLLLGSRDTIRKYYGRLNQLMGTRSESLSKQILFAGSCDMPLTHDDRAEQPIRPVQKRSSLLLLLRKPLLKLLNKRRQRRAEGFQNRP
jgi:hypothetical protein